MELPRPQSLTLTTTMSPHMTLPEFHASPAAAFTAVPGLQEGTVEDFQHSMGIEEVRSRGLHLENTVRARLPATGRTQENTVLSSAPSIFILAAPDKRAIVTMDVDWRCGFVC